MGLAPEGCKRRAGGSVTALSLEATGPGVSPEGCRSALGGMQKNSRFLSSLQLKIRCISTWLEWPGQRKGLKGGQCHLSPCHEKCDIVA